MEAVSANVGRHRATQHPIPSPLPLAWATDGDWIAVEVRERGAWVEVDRFPFSWEPEARGGPGRQLETELRILTAEPNQLLQRIRGARQTSSHEHWSHVNRQSRLRLIPGEPVHPTPSARPHRPAPSEPSPQRPPAHLRLVPDPSSEPTPPTPAATPPRPQIDAMERRQVRAELAALYARLKAPADSRQPIVTRTPAELAAVAVWWATAQVRALETQADDLRAARLVLTAAQAGLLEPVAAEVVSGEAAADPLAMWRVLFSPVRTRQIIGAVRRVVDRLCAAPLRELEKLREQRRALRKVVASCRLSALQEDELALQVKRNPKLTPGERTAILRGHAAAAKGARKRAKAAKKTLGELTARREKLRRSQPGAGQILSSLSSVCALWKRRDGAWPLLAADLERAERVMPDVLWQIAAHALELAWRGTVPRRWLVSAGYHAAPAEDDRPTKTARRLTVTRDRRFDVLLPAGTVVTELLDGDLTATEAGALRRSRGSERRRHDQQLDAWLVSVVEVALADPRLVEDLKAREQVWARNGAEGKKAAKAHYIALGQTLHAAGRLSASRPWLHELIAFRWPLDGGPMRYGHLKVDLKLGEARTVAPTPTPTPRPPALVLVDDLDDDDDLDGLTLPALDPAPPPSAPAPAPTPPPAPPAPSPAASTRPLLPTRLCVLDTETTGMSRDAEVHEIGAVLVGTDGVVIDEYSGQGRPEDLRLKGIHRALQVSGLRVADLMRRRRPIAEVIAEFEAWLIQHGSPPCVAYNQSFDKRMLAQTGLDGLVWGEDVMKTAKRALGLRSCKLSLALERFHIDTDEQNHRAIDDARQTVAVLLAAHRKLQGAA